MLYGRSFIGRLTLMKSPDGMVGETLFTQTHVPTASRETRHRLVFQSIAVGSAFTQT